MYWTRITVPTFPVPSVCHLQEPSDVGGKSAREAGLPRSRHRVPEIFVLRELWDVPDHTKITDCDDVAETSDALQIGSDGTTLSRNGVAGLPGKLLRETRKRVPFWNDTRIRLPLPDRNGQPRYE